ncbi:MAG: hypothetical protein ABR529_12435 [Actinomycetota bacterium]
MIDELTLGKRYRIALSGGAYQGALEGVLRSTRLPLGVLGNSDGEHRIWVMGEAFDWFLRVGDIEAIEELDDTEADEVRQEILPRKPCPGLATRPLEPRRRARRRG